MEEATGAPSSFAVSHPRRLRASGRDEGRVMIRPSSPLTMLLSRHTRRRKFITLLGGAAAWPLAARAQQTGKLPIVGFLVPGTPATHGQWFAALAQRLRDFGWIDGRNITVEYRWAEGRPERFAEIAAEFVRLKVDVIATSATGPTLAANQATRSIPIVFAGVADAVGSGLVTNLARPSGNVTGLSVLFTDRPASASSYCARLFLVSVDWRS